MTRAYVPSSRKQSEIDVANQCRQEKVTDMIDTDTYKEWIGRSKVDTDLITRTPLNALAATLNCEPPESVVPPLWHWVYFLSPVMMRDIGTDGHATGHDFLPEVPLPRRMRAGGRFTFTKLLEIDEKAERVSTIDNVEAKNGASGQLIFVTLRHEISGDRGARITEIENIVYREAPEEGAKPVAHNPPDLVAQWTRTITPDPVLLFNYSAATLNPHRIHYDRPYAMETEGYPGLVVHGPLVATLLLQLLAENNRDAAVREFSYTAVGPLFDTSDFRLCGRVDGSAATLWAVDRRNSLALTAQATFRPKTRSE